MAINRASDGGDRFTPKDHVGELLLITPTGTDEVQTSNSKEPTRVTIADVVVLDEAHEGEAVETFDEAFIFPKVVQGQLRKFIGRGQVVGRLYEDKRTQKAGQSAPWKLSVATDEEADLAEAYLAAQAAGGNPLEDDDEDEVRPVGRRQPAAREVGGGSEERSSRRAKVRAYGDED